MLIIKWDLVDYMYIKGEKKKKKKDENNKSEKIQSHYQL